MGRPSEFTQQIADTICDQIYGLYCPVTGDLRYIGKAKDARARLKGHLRDCRRRQTPLYVWMRSLTSQPIVRILAESLDWAATERELIAQHRANGADLLNVSAGGNQPHCPVDVRRENGRKNAASIHSDAFRRHIWNLNRRVGSMLAAGILKQSHRVKIRQAAIKRPDLFGRWTTI